MSTRFCSAKDVPLRLGAEIGRGGEGSVFEMIGHVDVVAKIYHSAPDKEQADKLVAMANGRTERLGKIAAWPIDTIHETAGGQARGFIMRRVARQKDIHVLYGPKTRLRDYPDATYRFLVHVAANLARAFAVVHNHGHVIGDVNQGGVCVSAKGTVTLVDCDSFQVHVPHRVFACNVGTPIYQPHELQAVRSFHGVARTQNHDAFGLAVLIFQTLFLARHPFAGAFQGDGDMPIERAIQEFRFAYGRDAVQRKMRQPPGSLGLGAVPPSVAVLFERAFLETGIQGGRPTAIEWATALDEFLLELRECAQNPGHSYARTITKCPLCEIESRVGVLLFLPPRQAEVHAPVLDIENLWRELVPIIASTQLPAAGMQERLPVISPSRAIVQFKRAKARAEAILLIGVAASALLAMMVHSIAIIGIFASIVIAFVVRGPVPEEARNIRDRFNATQERINRVLRYAEIERTKSSLPALQSSAEALYRRLSDFPRRRSETLIKFERSRYERQMRRYLNEFEVKDSRLKGFGSGLFAALVSNGVETADDLTIARLESTPGFGPKRISALLAWRRSLESRFRFNPSDLGESQELSRVERELYIEYSKDASELLRLASLIKTQSTPLRRRIEGLSDELRQARRELAIVRSTATALGEVV